MPSQHRIAKRDFIHRWNNFLGLCKLAESHLDRTSLNPTDVNNLLTFLNDPDDPNSVADLRSQFWNGIYTKLYSGERVEGIWQVHTKLDKHFDFDSPGVARKTCQSLADFAYPRSVLAALEPVLSTVIDDEVSIVQDQKKALLATMKSLADQIGELSPVMAEHLGLRSLRAQLQLQQRVVRSKTRDKRTLARAISLFSLALLTEYFAFKANEYLTNLAQKGLISQPQRKYIYYAIADLEHVLFAEPYQPSSIKDQIRQWKLDQKRLSVRHNLEAWESK